MVLPLGSHPSDPRPLTATALVGGNARAACKARWASSPCSRPLATPDRPRSSEPSSRLTRCCHLGRQARCSRAWRHR